MSDHDAATVQVRLPAHLRTLAEVTGPVLVRVEAPVTPRAVLDALETAHPVLAGTIRDRVSHQRRDFVRLYAGQEDWSHEPVDTPLPAAVAAGDEPLRIIGAMAGG